MNRAEPGPGNLAPQPPLCEPLHHQYQRLTATVKGVEVAVRVVCTACRRTPTDVLLASPIDRQAFEAYVLKQHGP